MPARPLKVDVQLARDRESYVAMRIGLSWGAAAIVDDMVGTLYGATRAEVLRFIVISWLHQSAKDRMGQKGNDG